MADDMLTRAIDAAVQRKFFSKDKLETMVAERPQSRLPPRETATDRPKRSSNRKKFVLRI